MSKTDFPSVDLNEILAVGQLPAMPQSAMRLLEIARDPDCGPAEFALPIEADPGLTVQVLRFVNSSYFGFRQEISHVKQAIALVGMRTIKNFALYSAIFSMIPDPKCGPFNLRQLWQDSLRRALFARAMGRVLGLEEAEEPFVAALLQDMAVPLLAKEVPGAYTRLFGACERSNYRIRLSALEQHVFGWNHAKAAGMMARQWRLPENCAILIEDHLDVGQWASHAAKEPGKLAVAMSALLPAIGDPQWAERSLFEDHYQTVCRPGSPSISELFAAVDGEFAEFAPVLRVAVPANSLVSACAEPVAAAEGP